MRDRIRYTFSVEERVGSPFWQARIYFEGQGGASRRFSTGIRIGDRPRESQRQAETVARERAEALARGVEDEQKVTAAGAVGSLSMVAERLLRQKRADGRRARAVESLAFNLDRHVLPYFGEERDIHSIRRADLEGFKAHLSERHYQPTTINNALTAIRQALKHACEVDELLEAVPHVRNVPVDQQGKGRALTRAELAALLAAVEERESREWLTFVANTGLRREEALAIKWSWVDWRALVIRIPAEVRKGGKPQKAPTPMNAAVRKLLRARQKRSKQPTAGRVWWQRRRQRHDQQRNLAATKVGLGRVRTHDLRHTLGSLAHAAGAAATEVRDLLGHSTLAMVSRYGHSYQDRLKALAERVKTGSVTGSVTGRKRRRGGKKGTSKTRKTAENRQYIRLVK